MNERPFAFVLMPFDPAFDDVYRLGIQGAAEAAGLDAKRLDDELFDRTMLEQIYSEIDRADLIIADMSGRNANVFYEAGYADAKKKLIIFLTKKKEDIPFDLMHRPHIIYGDSLTLLKAELTTKLRWAASEICIRKSQPLQLNVAVLDPDLIRLEHTDVARATFRIEVHNISDSTVRDIDAIYLFTTDSWTISQHGKQCIVTPHQSEKGRELRRHIIDPGFNSLPAKDWRPVDVTAERTVWASWWAEDEEERRDSHIVRGLLRVSLHASHFEIKHEQQIATKFLYEEIPF